MEILAGAVQEKKSISSTKLFELCNDELLFSKPEQMKEAIRELVDHKVNL